MMIYVSTARRLMTPDELGVLLSQAQSNNARQGISGMLLYREGSFMQMVEGEKKAIAALHHRLALDTRHRSMTVLLERDIHERTFSKWSMAFTRVGHLTEEQRVGHSPFLSHPFNDTALQHDPNQALLLLRSFRRDGR